MKLNYIPISDEYGIIGYHWECKCSRILKFVSGGEICECGFILPLIDPDDWYDKQMNKTVEKRDWNIKNKR